MRHIRVPRANAERDINPSVDSESQPARSDRKPALSRLAVASAVLGVVSVPMFCCAMVLPAMAAVMLGMLALMRIRMSPEQVAGRRFAWIGISSGATALVLTWALAIFAGSLQRDWDRQLDEGVQATLAATDEDAARTALRAWSAGSSETVSAAEIRRFAEVVRARYGPLESMSMVRQESSPSLFGDSFVIHVVNLEFESGTRTGVVKGRLDPAPGDVVPSLFLASIVVSGSEEEGGDLRFPEAKRREADGITERNSDRNTDGSEPAQSGGTTTESP
jgi:hypothetical protein